MLIVRNRTCGSAIALAAVAFGACKSRAPGPAPAQSASMAACASTITSASGLPATARLGAVIAACPVCDWSTILAWSKAPEAGGPPLRDLDIALKACKVFCNGTADGEFHAGLEDARGPQAPRTPWRYLQRNCPSLFIGDQAAMRYVGAPWLAVSKIAQSAEALSAEAPLEFPVPLWSSQGTGLLLPTVPVAATDGQVTGPVLTITLAELQTGEAPSAMLRKGVITLHGDYPGAVLADDAVIQPANAPPPTLVAPIGLLASRFANVAGHLPDATLAVFVDAGLANWPVAMKLRSRWRTLAANEGNALQINVADGTWQLDPRSPPVPIPAATSITARVAALRAAHPEFGQAAVVLRYGASSTVGDLVDWVVALAPTQWTAEAAPTK
ncbi:MAG TPA: hypothetical protein PLF40_25240 [Kofleriaceae bacterium]|nr:hypothetical protein [Kofleriaceae bacterium]